MITLSQITMRQYIDMMCGDDALFKGMSAKERAENRSRLILDYAMLSDEVGTRKMVNDQERARKAKAEVLLFKVCCNLMAAESYDEVRKLLCEYGIRSAQSMNNDRLEAEVKRLLKRAESTVKRHEEQSKDKEDVELNPEQIRLSFDKQAASLMTYFKFQIDLNTLAASQFATMIDLANKEIKAKLKAVSKKV